MNPRRIHTLMTAHFPTIDRATLAWTNILESDGKLREGALYPLLETFLAVGEVLVEVDRKHGAALARQDVAAWLRDRVGRNEIRIADRGFGGFVVVTVNGVAAGWRQP